MTRRVLVTGGSRGIGRATALVGFLFSDQAGYITGLVISVNGGRQ
jgi:hypothetical protein